MNYLKFSLTIVVASFSISFSSAQSLENKKIITATFKDVTFDYDKGANFSQTFMEIKSQITFGKVNSRNVLFAYGVELDYGLLTDGPDHGYRGFGASPMMVVQKFIRLSDVFYLSPSIVAMGGYYQSKTTFRGSDSYRDWRQFRTSLELIPISIMYVFNPKMNLMFSLGQFSLDYRYNNINSNVEPINNLVGIDDSEYVQNFSGLNYFGGISRVSLGVQFVF